MQPSSYLKLVGFATMFNPQEELVAKVLEFLEKPHKTTEVLLEQKELVRMAIILMPSLPKI